MPERKVDVAIVQYDRSEYFTMTESEFYALREAALKGRPFTVFCPTFEITFFRVIAIRKMKASDNYPSATSVVPHVR